MQAPTTANTNNNGANEWCTRHFSWHVNDADAADEAQRAKRAHAYFCALCKTRQARLNGDGDGDARRLACLLARPECNYLTLFSDSARRARAHPPSSIGTETTRIVPVPGRAIAAAVCRIFQIAQFIAASEREHDNTQTQSTHTENTHTHSKKKTRYECRSNCDSGYSGSQKSSVGHCKQPQVLYRQWFLVLRQQLCCVVFIMGIFNS